MDSNTLGRTLVLIGVLITVAGILLVLGGKVGFFGLGRLPGDIRIERPGFQFYFPLATSIVISVVLTAVLYLLSRLR